MIKVSVIVPVYKVPLEYLRECFDSLLAQTMQDCEFIVVSDGAPDAECSVCEEYAKKDPRFKFFRREHAGVSATRNFGIGQAQGKYITFVDSDDWIENGLTNLWNYAKDYNSDIVLCDCILIRENQRRTLSLQKEKISRIPESTIKDIIRNTIHLKNHNYIPAVSMCCKLYKSSLIKKHTFSQELVFGEDRIFNLSLYIQKGINISYFNKALYYYRKNRNSVTEKYNPVTDILFINFLKKLQTTLKGRYKQEIAADAISLLYASWRLNHLNINNTASLSTRVNRIISFYYSRDFQRFIKNFDTKNQPLIIRIEYWLLQHKFKSVIWIHAIKAMVFPIGKK